MVSVGDQRVLFSANCEIDSSQVDFTNPENFYHDVNSVAGLLKQFFRDLPDPLFTSQFYADFVNSARIDDDIQRRDSLHALINSLPYAHYATLRAIILVRLSLCHMGNTHTNSPCRSISTKSKNIPPKTA